LGNASGLGSFKSDAEKATAAANVFGGAMRTAGRDVRLLGRITQLADLTGFGRVLQLAGKNASLLILPGVVAGVERLAASAAPCRVRLRRHGGGSPNKLPPISGKFAAVVIALGGSFDDAGKAAKTFEHQYRYGVWPPPSKRPKAWPRLAPRSTTPRLALLKQRAV
jgi:hypothetical protein